MIWIDLVSLIWMKDTQSIGVVYFLGSNKWDSFWYPADGNLCVSEQFESFTFAAMI